MIKSLNLLPPDRCFDFMKYSSYQSESPRFFYNSTSYRCERLFGSCGSNKNVFETLESCEALCNEKCKTPITNMSAFIEL